MACIYFVYNDQSFDSTIHMGLLNAIQPGLSLGARPNTPKLFMVLKLNLVG